MNRAAVGRGLADRARPNASIGNRPGVRNASAIRAARLRAATSAGIAASNRLNWNANRLGLNNRVRPGAWAGVNNRGNAWNRYGNNWNRLGYRYWRPYYGFTGGRWNNWGWNRWAWSPWWRLVPGIRFWPWFGGFGYGGYGYGNYGYNNGYGYSNYSSYPSSTYYDQSTYAPTYVDQQAAPADQPAAATATATATATAETNRFADEGEAFFREGKYREAAQSFRHALVEDPQNGVLIQLLAQALFATEQYDEAAAAVQQSLMMLPEDQWGLIPSNVRELYSSQAAYDSQLATLKRAVEGKDENDRSPAERFLLAYQLGFSGQRQEALDQLAEVRKAVPEDQASERLAEVLKNGPNAGAPQQETLPTPSGQPGSR